MLPVNPAPVHAPPASDSGTAKRRRRNALPQTFLCFVRDLHHIFINGVFVVDSCNSFADNAVTSPQYLDLLALGKPAPKSNYVTWGIASAAPISPPLKLSEEDVISHGALVGEGLTRQGIDKVLGSKVSIGGELVSIQLFVQGLRLRTWPSLLTTTPEITRSLNGK